MNDLLIFKNPIDDIEFKQDVHYVQPPMGFIDYVKYSMTGKMPDPLEFKGRIYCNPVNIDLSDDEDISEWYAKNNERPCSYKRSIQVTTKKGKKYILHGAWIGTYRKNEKSIEVVFDMAKEN